MTTIQSVVGLILFYRRVIGSTIPTSYNEISMQQTKATQLPAAATTQLLDYAATHPEASITFRQSDIQMWIYTDASCISVSKARRYYREFFFLLEPPNHKVLLD